jgi:hypothetical protein
MPRRMSSLFRKARAKLGSRILTGQHEQIVKRAHRAPDSPVRQPLIQSMEDRCRRRQ